MRNFAEISLIPLFEVIQNLDSKSPASLFFAWLMSNYNYSVSNMLTIIAHKLESLWARWTNEGCRSESLSNEEPLQKFKTFKLKANKQTRENPDELPSLNFKV